MKRTSLLVAILVALSSARWVSFGQPQGAPQVKILSETHGRTTLEFKLNGYEIRDVVIDGKTHAQIALPGVVTYLEKGLPELPRVTASIIIPDRSVMDYRIIQADYETIETNPVIPSKGNLTRDIDPEKIPYTFDAFYQTDRYFPKEVVALTTPFILRDLRGISLVFNPLQFNPARSELKICKRLVIEVYESGTGGDNTIDKRLPGGMSGEFVDIYRDFFINFSPAKYDSISERAGRMLIITADAYVNNLRPFVEWKRKKGIQTKLVRVSTIGNNNTAIQNYIQNEFNAGGLVWILLIGDAADVVANQVTVGTTTYRYSDPSYAYLRGGDWYPDAFISRFSANSAADVDNQVNRSINYEKIPTPGGTWYKQGIGIASAQGTPADSTRMNWTRSLLLSYNYTLVDKIYDPTANAAMVTSAVNNGRSIGNYMGHGSETAWGTTGFSVSHVQALVNGNMLPFINSVACLNGRFYKAGGPCFAEAWLNAGSSSNPAGAIAFYGSCTLQAWIPPTVCQAHACTLLSQDKKNTIAGLWFNGSARMVEVYLPAFDGVKEYVCWHLFGDGSIQARTNTPQAMTVSHAGAILIGQTYFDVTVTGLPNALVGLYMDTSMVGSAYTNTSGQARVSFIVPVNTPGSMHVTVTAYNKIPYLATVPVITPNAPFVLYLKHTSNDQSGGNGDGQPNPGETILMPVWVKNQGSQQANNVNGRLRLKVADPYITLLDSTCSYGNILPGDSAVSNPDFRYRIANNCPDQHNVLFTLVCTGDSTWTSDFSTMVYAPVVSFAGVSIVDTIANGNRNRVFEPGETVLVYVQLANTGGAAISAVTETLSTNSSYVSILRNASSYGTINAGATVTCNPPYVMRASPTTPVPHFANVFENIRGTCYLGMSFADTFQVSVGRTGWRDNVEDTMVTRQYAREALWHSTTRRSYSPAHAWWCGDPNTGQYVNNMNSSLTTPQFYLGTSDTVLTYYTYYTTESGYDYGYVEVSTNNGSTWNQLVSYNGTSSAWIRGRHRLNYSPGTQVLLRFRFTSDGSVLYEGWFVDDININNGLDVAEEMTLRPEVITELVTVLPNPFIKAVGIKYSLPDQRHVKITVYDISGKLVTVLTDQKMKPGQYSIVWDGADERGRKVAAGVYFTKVKLGQSSTVRKLVLLK